MQVEYYFKAYYWKYIGYFGRQNQIKLENIEKIGKKGLKWAKISYLLIFCAFVCIAPKPAW